MKRYTLWLSALLTCIGLSLGSSAWADSLIVGVNASYKPLAFKQDNELMGMEISTAEALGKRLKRDIEFKELPWEQLIPALQSGEIDVIMSGMSITEDRKQLVDFSTPYLKIGQMAIILNKNIARLSAPRAIFEAGAKVGVESGTTGATFAKEMLINGEIKLYTAPPEAFAALRKGDIDFYVHDAPTSWKLAQESEYSDLLALYRPLTRESLAWAVKKGNDSLLKQLNAGLVSMEADGSLQLIQNHWIPVKIAVGL